MLPFFIAFSYRLPVGLEIVRSVKPMAIAGAVISHATMLRPHSGDNLNQFVKKKGACKSPEKDSLKVPAT